MGLGLAKGVRSVYMSLVVPSYIPLERLAAASGIQMVANGVIILSMGSFVGKINLIIVRIWLIILSFPGLFRDIFGSYAICIVFINFVTFTTLVLWTIEMIYMKKQNEKKAKDLKENEILELCKFNVEVN